MRKKVILITGAAGEIGQALVEHLTQQGAHDIVTLDLNQTPPHDGVAEHIRGDILDNNLFLRLVTRYDFDTIFHLAALLSSRAEFSPSLAHRVNVDGTMNLLQMAAEQSQHRGEPVKFIFPSSIAVFGLPSLAIKAQNTRLREWEYNDPKTMYGCNKLYGEMLGTYFGRNYRLLARNRPVMLDFRSVRFPGLISAFTLPTGGTSDYGPEMLHAAAQGQPYSCFVRPDSTIPFMAMPDAVAAITKLADAPRASLSRSVYNVTGFSLSAAQFAERVHGHFSEADITFEPDLARQAIVDSWPASLNDDQAKADWGWEPQYNVQRAFDDYLIPNISARYS